MEAATTGAARASLGPASRPRRPRPRASRGLAPDAGVGAGDDGAAAPEVGQRMAEGGAPGSPVPGRRAVGPLPDDQPGVSQRAGVMGQRALIRLQRRAQRTRGPGPIVEAREDRGRTGWAMQDGRCTARSRVEGDMRFPSRAHLFICGARHALGKGPPPVWARGSRPRGAPAPSPGSAWAEPRPPAEGPAEIRGVRVAEDGATSSTLASRRTVLHAASSPEVVEDDPKGAVLFDEAAVQGAQGLCSDGRSPPGEATLLEEDPLDAGHRLAGLDGAQLAAAEPSLRKARGSEVLSRRSRIRATA